MTIREVLRSVDLENLADSFEREGVDVAAALSLTDADLASLGVARIGDRARLRRSLGGGSGSVGGNTVVPPMGAGQPPRIVQMQRVAKPKVIPPGPQQVLLQFGAVQLDWWLLDTLQLGRSLQDGADIQIALEPFEPAEQYPENHRLSYLISRVHLRLERHADAIVCVPVGSGGTTCNDVKAAQNLPFVVKPADVICVAKVLTMEMQLAEGGGAFHIKRRENLPELSYLFGARAIGLFHWEGEVTVCTGEGAEGRSAYLVADEQGVHLRSDKAWTCNEIPVEPDELHLLQQGDVVSLLDKYEEPWTIQVCKVV